MSYCIKAIQRYIKYIVKINTKNLGLCVINHDDSIDITGRIHSNKTILFFSIKPNHHSKLINLIDIANLTKNIKVAPKTELTNSQILNIPEIRYKIDQFFKGHGKEAIFFVLNKVQLGFKNGLNPFLQKEYNQKDLDNKFLKPGLKNWKLFIERFKKYEDFLYVCGFRDEVNKINKLIFVTKPNMKYIDQNRIEKSIAERENIVNSLEKIDKLLMNMKKKVEEYK